MREIVSLENIDPEKIETLLDDAFGTDRHKRTAYLLRKSTKAVPSLSFASVEGSDLLGSIQCWPVRIGDCSLVLVGPVAVASAMQGTGIGHQLMNAMLEAASKNGEPAMVMVGDPEYYGRFGFSAQMTGGWSLPRPWEPRRLLARNAGGWVLPVAGLLEEGRDAL